METTEQNTKQVMEESDVLKQFRRLYAVGRGSNLYFDFTIDYTQALAFRRANGDYLREGQWKDFTVEVYII